MLGDRLKGLGGLLLFLSCFLGCLGNLLGILCILLRVEELLVGLSHWFLYGIDHVQCAIGIFGGLQLCRIEDVLFGRQLQESFLQALDALLDLLLLFGIFLSWSFWVFCFLFEFFGFLGGELSKLRNRWRKTRKQLSSCIDRRLGFEGNRIELTEQFLEFGCCIEHRLVISRAPWFKLLSDGVGAWSPPQRIDFVGDWSRKTGFLHPCMRQIEAMVHAIPLAQVTESALGAPPIVLFQTSKGIEDRSHVLKLMRRFQDSIGLGDRL